MRRQTNHKLIDNSSVKLNYMETLKRKNTIVHLEKAVKPIAQTNKEAQNAIFLLHFIFSRSGHKTCAANQNMLGCCSFKARIKMSLQWKGNKHSELIKPAHKSVTPPPGTVLIHSVLARMLYKYPTFPCAFWWLSNARANKAAFWPWIWVFLVSFLIFIHMLL